ncbi:MAG TPA: LacI family DNA-binding transcriptional regulator [Negativicutes bacterium]|nr:LacI family DNA-binding transcriptional regulator [Negativicutes bacterium]
MAITIKDVAKKAGVDPSTVSRVIADNPRISAKTKEKVLKVMEELEFHPNAIARSLASRSTKTIGVIMPHSTEQVFVNPFFTEVMRGIGVSALKQGYNVLFSTGSTGEEEYKATSSLVNEKRVDGLILLTSRIGDKTIANLGKKHFPFVVVGKPSNTEDANWVDNDNLEAGFQATEHLINLGHKRIGFIGGEFSYVFMGERFKGYKKALDANGIKFDKELLSLGEFVEEGGFTAAGRLLEQPACPTAIVVADDLMAFGAIRAIKQNRLSIPGDISIIGFNDTPMASYMDPPLSSVEIFVYELGYNASEMLISQLHETAGHKKHIIIPTRLISRKSTGKAKK